MLRKIPMNFRNPDLKALSLAFYSPKIKIITKFPSAEKLLHPRQSALHFQENTTRDFTITLRADKFLDFQLNFLSFSRLPFMSFHSILFFPLPSTYSLILAVSFCLPLFLMLFYNLPTPRVFVVLSLFPWVCRERWTDVRCGEEAPKMGQQVQRWDKSSFFVVEGFLKKSL